MQKFNSIVEAVAWNASNNPDKLCVIDEKEYTYASFFHLIMRICVKLKNEKVLQGDSILAECNQSAEFLAVSMACQLLGIIFVPMEKNVNEASVGKYIKETNAKIIVSDKYNNEIGIKVISYIQLCEITSEENVYSFPCESGIAEILFTTGTTGSSKGIIISNKANVALAENIITGTQMQHNNVELIPLPISHSHGLRSCYANLLNGSTIVLADGVLFIKKIFALIEKYSVSAIDLAPSAADIILKLSKNKLQQFSQQLDYVQIGTAFLKENTKEQLIQLLPNTRLYNFYGSIEAGRCCVLNFNEYRNKKYCIGKPTVNAKIKIVDDSLNEVISSSEKMGMLAIGGDMNMNAYLGKPELTSKTLIDGYVITNDIGYIDIEGFIYVLGRKDDVINYKGIKIAPEEIEQIIVQYDGIEDCACIPIEDKISGQVPMLFITTTDADLDISILNEYISKNIDENKRPKKIIKVKKIPRTENGKIKRKELKEKYNE